MKFDPVWAIFFAIWMLLTASFIGFGDYDFAQSISAGFIVSLLLIFPLGILAGALTGTHAGLKNLRDVFMESFHSARKNKR